MISHRVFPWALAATKGSVKLKFTSQGCADVGVCYTPLEQMVEVSLPGGGIQ